MSKSKQPTKEQLEAIKKDRLKAVNDGKVVKK